MSYMYILLTVYHYQLLCKQVFIVCGTHIKRVIINLNYYLCNFILIVFNELF